MKAPITKHQSPSNNQMTNDTMSQLVIGTCGLVIPTEGRL